MIDLKNRLNLITFSLCSLIVATSAYSAENVIQPQILELPKFNLPDIQQQPQIKSNIENATTAEQQQPQELNDEDLKQNIELAEFIIQQALQQKNWRTLKRIMQYYPDIPNADPMLVHYIRGAIYRNEAKHKKAITEYREMLNSAPDLTMVRFDLAAMQFENKQYRDAKQNFSIVQKTPDLPPEIQAYLQQYLMAIDKQKQLNGTLELGALYNDNVNQASDNKFLTLKTLAIIENEDGDEQLAIVDIQIPKDKASYPQSSFGYHYNLGLNKQWNIYANHFLTAGGSISTDLYEAAPDYNELLIQFKSGYQFQNVNSWLKAEPLIMKRLLDYDDYSLDKGMSLEYGRFIKQKWQLSGNYLWLDRSYDQGLERYDGNTNIFSTTAVYFHNPQTALFSGLSYQDDDLNDQSESSKRYSIQFGAVKQWASGFNLKTNLSYAYRDFNAPNFLKGIIREDNEYQIGLDLSQQKWNWFGFTPKLTYSYLNVDSNIEELYSRKNHKIAFTLQTNF